MYQELTEDMFEIHEEILDESSLFRLHNLCDEIMFKNPNAKFDGGFKIRLPESLQGTGTTLEEFWLQFRDISQFLSSLYLTCDNQSTGVMRFESRKVPARDNVEFKRAAKDPQTFNSTRKNCCMLALDEGGPKAALIHFYDCLFSKAIVKSDDSITTESLSTDNGKSVFNALEPKNLTSDGDGENCSLYFNGVEESSNSFLILIAPSEISRLSFLLATYGMGGIGQTCIQQLHHKTDIVFPQWLLKHGIRFKVIILHPGEFFVFAPNAAHTGGNMGPNLAEACNFGTPDWLPFGSVASLSRCYCLDHGVQFDVTQLIEDHRKELLPYHQDKAMWTSFRDEHFQRSLIIPPEACYPPTSVSPMLETSATTQAACKSAKTQQEFHFITSLQYEKRRLKNKLTDFAPEIKLLVSVIPVVTVVLALVSTAIGTRIVMHARKVYLGCAGLHCIQCRVALLQLFWTQCVVNKVYIIVHVTCNNLSNTFKCSQVALLCQCVGVADSAFT
ncbi:hypothetical protein L1887_57642 [Cichorium endivia]|nr:hypothetical protein L1887_57642 [Cichorium endivia]